MYTKIKRDELIYYINNRMLESYSLDLLSKRQLAALADAKVAADDETLIKITDEQLGTVAQG